jgi:hypothetical protein
MMLSQVMPLQYSWSAGISSDSPLVPDAPMSFTLRGIESLLIYVITDRHFRVREPRSF